MSLTVRIFLALVLGLEGGIVFAAFAALDVVVRVEAALDAGARTRDLGGALGTAAMGDAVLARL